MPFFQKNDITWQYKQTGQPKLDMASSSILLKPHAQKVHSFIRAKLKEKLAGGEKMRILYGGSMKPENAGELLSMPDIDGGLIGGASLNAEQFLAIALAAPKI